MDCQAGRAHTGVRCLPVDKCISKEPAQAQSALSCYILAHKMGRASRPAHLLYGVGVRSPHPYSTKPMYSGGQYENHACPTMCSIGTGPKLRESLEAPRLSPRTKTCSGGMVCGL